MVLDGKVLVVAGVGDGLGQEIARLALRDRAKVVISARSEKKLAAIARELDPSGERILACPGDISDEASCEALMQARWIDLMASTRS